MIKNSTITLSHTKLTLIFNLCIFSNDKCFQETTCRYVNLYSSFQTIQKVYMILKSVVTKRCVVSYRYTIVTNGLKIDETTCRSSKGHVISERDTY